MRGKKAKLMRKAMAIGMNRKVDKRSKKLYNMLNSHEKTVLGMTYQELIAKHQ